MELIRQMKRALAGAALVAVATTAQAQDPQVAALERQLAERDRVILELVERVEALERRVGLQHGAAEPAAAGAGAEAADTAPGAVVVGEGAAERALERSLTRAGALLLPKGVLEIEPSVSYARHEDTTPALFTTEDGVVVGESERNGNALTADLALRLGLPWDSQLEVGIPYRWRQVESVDRVGFGPAGASSDSGSGLGDLRVGLAKTLLREGLWTPDLIGRVTWDTGTGTGSEGGVSLGGGFDELRGSLTAIKRQDPVAFVGSLGYEYSFAEDHVRPGPLYSASFGSYVALSPETSLRLQFSGGYQERTELFGHAVDGSDRVLGSFTVGGSTLLAPGTLLNLSAGLGLTDDADDFTLSVSLPIRFGGPLF